jgi:hypothetical protein
MVAMKRASLKAAPKTICVAIAKMAAEMMYFTLIRFKNPIFFITFADKSAKTPKSALCTRAYAF